jgi:hypothetical protein
MGDSHGFWVKTTEDFSTALDKCEDTIRAGFAALDKMKDAKDWAGITTTMRTCQNITEDNYMHMLGWARNAMATMVRQNWFINAFNSISGDDGLPLPNKLRSRSSRKPH